MGLDDLATTLEMAEESRISGCPPQDIKVRDINKT